MDCVKNNAGYAWAWNQPRQAIGREPSLAVSGFDYLTPDGTRRHIDFADLCEEDERPPREKLLRRRIAALPQYVRRHFAAKLEALDAQSHKAADYWLINTFERHVLTRIDRVNNLYQPVNVLPGVLLPVRDQLFRMLWAGKKELKRLAYTLADIFTSEFIRESEQQLKNTGDPEFAAIYSYGYIASLALHLRISVPGWSAYCSEELEAEDALRAVLRLESPHWWLNRLRRIHARWREHLMIATGYVQKKASPYSSAPCLTEWLAQKKANRDYLKAMDLEDQETGERISLIDKVAGSVANPANRRRELMTRMRGFEDLAKLDGLAGDFYTLTAPSRYHAMQHNGLRNNKYGGASPRETQKYLCRVWAKTRAKWRRKGIRAFGFRVVEPHHDATPHWHLLLFMRQEHIELARDIFRKFAMQEDGNEPGAEENRFQVVPIDEAHGSATGYIAKYISKNIDGFALDGEKDDETGEDLKEMSRRVSAWASRWSIRQFQQIGGAPVTVYRELRRLANRELVLHPELEVARQAADAGEWDNYVLAQGGPLVERDRLRIRLNYETTENGNAYGDDVHRITGIYSPLTGKDASLIFTRTTQYKIVPKHKSADSEAVDLGFSGGNAAPRSSVNNCTRNPATGNDGPEHAGDKAAVRSEMTAPSDGGTVNFDALSRKEKREIAQRLSEDMRRRRKLRQSEKKEPPELSVREKQVSELLALRGIDASAVMIRSLLSGAAIASGDLIFTVEKGRLITSNRGISTVQKHQNKEQGKSLIERFNRIRNSK